MCHEHVYTVFISNYQYALIVHIDHVSSTMQRGFQPTAYVRSIAFVIVHQDAHTGWITASCKIVHAKHACSATYTFMMCGKSKGAGRVKEE